MVTRSWSEPGLGGGRNDSLAPALGGDRRPTWRPDPRALKILFDAYWEKGLWKLDNAITEDDLAYGITAGVLFPPTNTPIAVVAAEARERADRLGPRRVGDAFLASLTTRRLDWRSALGSAAVLRHFDPRPYVEWAPYAEPQPHDLNGRSFARFKWGGRIHADLVYAWFDLGCFEARGDVVPTAEDRRIFRRILEAVVDAPAGQRPTDLAKGLTPLVASNKDEREILFSILADAGVITIDGRPSFFDGPTPEAGQAPYPYGGESWRYPMCWWRGPGRLNEEAIAYWFGEI